MPVQFQDALDFLPILLQGLGLTVIVTLGSLVRAVQRSVVPAGESDPPHGVGETKRRTPNGIPESANV